MVASSGGSGGHPVTRGAASRTSEAADALLAWLRSQRREPIIEGAAKATTDAADPAAPIQRPEQPGDGVVAGGTELVIATGTRTAPVPNGGLSAAVRSRAIGAPDRTETGAPLCLPNTDWLYHRLTVTGPAAAVGGFSDAAAGAGTVPWQLDVELLEEDVFHLLAAPPPPHERTLSAMGARVLAGQLRKAVERRHALAVARVGRNRACPFDLHALLPVPGDVLRFGPDDPAALAWLWENWGTTQALRHVATVAATGGSDERHPPARGETAVRVTFWSADWTPWRALARLAGRWPALRFDVRPRYDRS